MDYSITTKGDTATLTVTGRQHWPALKAMLARMEWNASGGSSSGGTNLKSAALPPFRAQNKTTNAAAKRSHKAKTKTFPATAKAVGAGANAPAPVPTVEQVDGEEYNTPTPGAIAEAKPLPRKGARRA